MNELVSTNTSLELDKTKKENDEQTIVEKEEKISLFKKDANENTTKVEELEEEIENLECKFYDAEQDYENLMWVKELNEQENHSERLKLKEECNQKK